ncbi:hypothetical protein NEMIN01_0494 [Nematocida minor]|uniref:uncharacterized protein n=1 Tax=Nematocida minor TaxID=1912983 RepID=UPI00221E4BF3|nr:uncharacterized protein NEMIN01_0494 [Nematocida minor]KAI5189431.1 hypothetical protein NEMIN01_0494 [Nematocida minor]
MILQKRLKQVIAIGATALACLQEAICVPEDKTILLYDLKTCWNSRMTAIEEQINIRKDFFRKAELIKANNMPDYDSAKDLDLIQELIQELDRDLLSLKKSWDKMENLVGALNRANAYNIAEEFRLVLRDNDPYDLLMGSIPHEDLPNSTFSFNEITYSEVKSTNSFDRKYAIDKLVRRKINDLRKLLLEMNDSSTALIGNIHYFNSQMLIFIERYSAKKYKGIKLEELAMFKLAKLGNIFPANIIFTFFEEEPLRVDANDELANKERLESIVKYLRSFVPNNDKIFYNYINTIMNDNCIEKNRLNQLILADVHFKNVFYECGLAMGENIMDIYYILLQKDLVGAEIDQFKDITHVQLIKLIMAEYLMNGPLLNYKKNRLFSNLEKIILSKTETEQDKVLDVLSMLWDDWYCEPRKRNPSLKDFYTDNMINADFFRVVRGGFVHSKWVYIIEAKNLDFPSFFSRDQVAERLHVDMSYMHPIWYMCKRYESISYLKEQDTKYGRKLFMSRENNLVTVRPYKISNRDDNIIRVENMRDFMNTCFSSIFVEFETACRFEETTGSAIISDLFFDTFDIRNLKRQKYLGPKLSVDEKDIALQPFV